MEYTNLGMVEYARCQLGEPYWYACYGQLGDRETYEYKRKQNPEQYPPKKWTEESFVEGFGHKVHDCSGLWKGYFCSPSPNEPAVYNSKFDWSANGLIEACTETGDIKTIPEIMGLVVWKKGHVGCYVGAGKVIEAKGHKWGVIMSDLKDTNWVRWGKCPYMKYIVNEPPIDEFVTRLYNIVLDREPEDGGKAFWVNGLKTNEFSFISCASAFLFCQEFKNRPLTDGQFLDVLYRTLFAREGDAKGMQYWLNYLDSHTRDDVTREFLASPEFKKVCNTIMNKV